MKTEHKLGIAIAAMTLCGMLWAAYSKPAGWDQTTKDVAELKPMVRDHDNRLAIMETHYIHIEDELKRIDKKLDD